MNVSARWSDQPHRILTGSDLSERLQQVSAARTRLAELGCKVLRQALNQGTEARPELELQAATPALTREVMPMPKYGEDGSTRWSAVLGSVLVSWKETRQ